MNLPEEDSVGERRWKVAEEVLRRLREEGASERDVFDQALQAHADLFGSREALCLAVAEVVVEQAVDDSKEHGECLRTACERVCEGLPQAITEEVLKQCDCIPQGVIGARSSPADTGPHPPPEELGALPTPTSHLPDVPGYEIVEELGRGGMGVVYKARQESINRVVALKMLLHGAHARPESRNRFKTEAAVVGRLQHPGIVQVFEAGEVAGLPYFSMEFVEGCSLHDRLKGDPVADRATAELLKKLATAMDYAHCQQVVHRDLKPQNVLLAEPPTTPLECCTPKITDFGLAKILDAEPQTATGEFLGTVEYMAPEQAKKARSIDPACDIYALGAILYTLLTGRPPFKGGTPLDTLRMVEKEEPAPPTKLNRTVPRDLETICLKCLEKDPRRRYTSAKALAEDLGRYLGRRPILARPAGWLERLVRWGRREPVVAGLLAAVFLVLGAGVVVSSVLGMKAAHSADLAEWKAAEADDERERANVEAGKAVAKAAEEKKARQESDRRLVENYLQRGLAAAQCGEVDRGLLWFVSALRQAERLGDKDLCRVLRLNLQSWSRQLNRLERVLELPGDSSSPLFSPGGQTILVARRLQNAEMWEVASGKRCSPDIPSRGRVTLFAVSRTGRLLLTGSGEANGFPKFLEVHEAVTGKPVGKPSQHTIYVSAACFSPDEQSYFSCTVANGNTIQRWEVNTGKGVGPSIEHPYPVLAIAVAPDGRTLLTAGGMPLNSGSTVRVGEARLRDASTGKSFGEPMRHSSPIHVVAFSPDGRTVLTGSADGTVRLWEAASGKPIGPTLTHSSLRCATFSPDGRTVVTGSIDRTVRLWEAETGKFIGQPLAHPDAIQAVVFRPDGKAVLTASGRAVWCWAVTAGNRLGAPYLDVRPKATAFSPDGRTILVGTHPGTTVQLHEAATGKALGRPLPHGGQAYFGIQASAFRPDGRTVATAGSAVVRLWRSDGLSLGPPLKHDTQINQGLVFREDGRALLTLDCGVARVWDMSTPPRLVCQMAHPNTFRLTGGFSADGKIIVTVGETSVQRWEATSGKAAGGPLVFGNAAGSGGRKPVAWSPDRRTLLIGRESGTARLYDIATGRPSSALFTHPGPVHAVAYGPDSDVILTASGAAAYLWDLATGQRRGKPLGHGATILSLGFSRDGRRVVTASQDRTARLWDARSGKPLARLLLHRGDVTTAIFSPLDGTLVATGSNDRTVGLWDAVTGYPIGPSLPHSGKVQQVAFNSTGTMLRTTSLCGPHDRYTTQVWEVPSLIKDSVETLATRVRVETGLDLTPDHLEQTLDIPVWQRLRQRLGEGRGGLTR